MTDNFFQDILNTPQRRMRARRQVSQQEQENIDGSPRRRRVAPSQPLDPVRSAQGLLSLSPDQRKQHSVSELVSGAETTIVHSPTWSRFFLSLLICPHLSTVPLLIARATSVRRRADPIPQEFLSSFQVVSGQPYRGCLRLTPCRIIRRLFKHPGFFFFFFSFFSRLHSFRGNTSRRLYTSVYNYRGVNNGWGGVAECMVLQYWHNRWAGPRFRMVLVHLPVVL